MATSRFVMRGAPTPKVCVLTYYFAFFFVETGMKTKEFGTGDASLVSPPWIRQ